MILLSACSLVQPQQEPTTTVLPTQTAAITTVEQPTPTASPSPTPIPSTPTSTPSPTVVPATPTPSYTPTPSAPVATVNLLAHCRYGPGTAYLHSADLHPGDQGQVDGRNASGTWLWIQPKDLDRHCWVATSVVTVQGDMSKLPEVSSKLPYSTLYGPPKDVDAEREGDQVVISWSPIPFTEDDFRGYMLELTTCQNGRLVTETVHTNETYYVTIDGQGCNQASSGRLWGVEKHGYTAYVTIEWP